MSRAAVAQNTAPVTIVTTAPTPMSLRPKLTGLVSLSKPLLFSACFRAPLVCLFRRRAIIAEPPRNCRLEVAIVLVICTPGPIRLSGIDVLKRIRGPQAIIRVVLTQCFADVSGNPLLCYNRHLRVGHSSSYPLSFCAKQNLAPTTPGPG